MTMFVETRSAGSGALLRAMALLACAAFTCGALLAEARPVGTPGLEAEALAEKMLKAVNHSAWQATGAVRWTFRGNREHLWDRQRSLARVRWDRVEVLLDLTTREGIVHKRGRELSGAERESLLRKAFAFWTNDAFWLNPVSKIFDEGTARSLVALKDGGQGLLVEYTSGGLTPGDAYLWILDESGLPIEWRMWVSALPIGGARASWEDWVVLSTGAWISKRHDLALGKVVLTDVDGAADLAGLDPGVDPFAELVTRRRGE